MWGAIIGGAMGLLGANKQAKAQDAATAAQMAGFKQYQPYVDANLSGSQAALTGILNTGAYTGQTYAGPNAFQTGTANTMGNVGANLIGNGYNMLGANANFGQNSQALYDQFQGLSQQAQFQDRLQNATAYAANNSDAIVNASMRDDYRNLTQNTLVNNNLSASGTGNINSSRAGVTDAIAIRDYNDRRADTSAAIQNQMIDRSLAQQAQQFADQGAALNAAGNANAAIQSAYTTGLNTLGEGANFGMNAGNSLQGYDQAGLTAAQNDFERMRDFEMQQRMQYQSGILSQAPNSSQSVKPNTVDPFQAAMGGAMSGFGFQQQYGPQIANYFKPQTQQTPVG